MAVRPCTMATLKASTVRPWRSSDKHTVDGPRTLSAPPGWMEAGPADLELPSTEQQPFCDNKRLRIRADVNRSLGRLKQTCLPRHGRRKIEPSASATPPRAKPLVEEELNAATIVKSYDEATGVT